MRPTQGSKASQHCDQSLDSVACHDFYPVSVDRNAHHAPCKTSLIFAAVNGLPTVAACQQESQYPTLLKAVAWRDSYRGFQIEHLYCQHLPSTLPLQCLIRFQFTPLYLIFRLRASTHTALIALAFSISSPMVFTFFSSSVSTF